MIGWLIASTRVQCCNSWVCRLQGCRTAENRVAVLQESLCTAKLCATVADTCMQECRLCWPESTFWATGR